MKSLLLVATLTFVAVQLIHAAPAPEDEKKEGKEAAITAPPGVVKDAVPSKPEIKAEAAVVSKNQEEKSSPSVSSSRPAEVAEKAQ